MLIHQKLTDNFSDIETALKEAFSNDTTSAHIAIKTIREILFGDDPVRQVIKNDYLLRFHFNKAFDLQPGELSGKKPQHNYLRMLFIYLCRLIFGYKYSNNIIGQHINRDAQWVADAYKSCKHYMFTEINADMVIMQQTWCTYLQKKIELLTINNAAQ